jgi:DNA primase
VLLGFDMDEAGNRAAARTMDLLRPHDIEVRLVLWPKKDPGDCSQEERLEAVAQAVGSQEYVPQWRKRVLDHQARYAP